MIGNNTTNDSWSDCSTTLTLSRTKFSIFSNKSNIGEGCEDNETDTYNEISTNKTRKQPHNVTNCVT